MSIHTEISFLPTTEGGRRWGVDLTGQYMPHLRVDGGDLLGVALRSDTISRIEPGESGTVTMDLPYNIDYSALDAGTHFEILEGNTRVGTGVVLRQV